MKRLFVLLLFLLTIASLPTLVEAQTTVNLTVQDTGSVLWTGPWTVALRPPPGFPPNTTMTIVSGGGSTAPQSGTLSGSGTAAISLPANSNMVPVGSVWYFTVCFGTTGNCFSQLVNVGTSSPQTLTIAPPAPGAPSSSGGGGITSVAVLPATCTPGVTSPSNLNSGNVSGFADCVAPNQFGNLGVLQQRFFGLSPTDYGAKFDMHTYAVCGQVLNVNTVTCSNNPFSATDCNSGVGCTGPVDKQFEMVCSGGASTPTHGTLTSFNSAGSMGFTGTPCTATQTNTGLAFGTDDTVADQAWVTAMIAAAVKGVPVIARSGYLPQGGSWTTKRIAFIYPGGQDGTTGEGAPGPTSGGQQLRPSLWILGAGFASTYFYIPSTFQWQSPSTSANVCAVLINHWDGSYISNFAIQSSMSNGVTNFNTTTNTGLVGGLCFEDNTHQNVTNMYVSGFANTTNTMPGVAISSDFESSYAYFADEVNNINWYWNPLGGSSSTGVLTAGAFEKELMDTIFLENPSVLAGTGNLVLGTGTYKQYRMRNIHFRSDSGSDRPINITSSAAPGTNDAIICDECRVTDVEGNGHQGITIQNGGRYNFPDLVYINTNAVSTNAAAVAFTASVSGVNISMVGGEINCNACTNAANLASGASIYAMDLTLTSPASHAAFITGAGTAKAFLRTATGWDGTGTIQSTQHISNQGTACTNGELALSAGWQSTGSATVTAAAGTGQTCSWTITTGTTTAANPTVTDTLTNALPAATTVCWMSINGGTHTPIVGAGTSDVFRQTTLSATAPIFTYQETPTAGGTTYFVTRGCGP